MDNTESLRGLVRAFEGQRLLIVGDLLLDEYIWGQVKRISPEAPVPILQITHRTYVPGGAANTAANVAQLGGMVTLGGVVGSDANAERLQAVLQERAMNLDGICVDPTRPTATKTRAVADNHQLLRMDHEVTDVVSEALQDEMIAWVERALPECATCIISDYAKGVVTPRIAQAVITCAGAYHKPCIVDPKGSDYSKYRGATVVTPNTHEAVAALQRTHPTEQDAHTLGNALVEMLNGTSILLTRGAEGMSLFRPEVAPVDLSAAARHVYDVTGAGDTVVAVLALALGAGADLPDAARLANLAAGLVVGKFGTATLTNQELVQAL